MNMELFTFELLDKDTPDIVIRRELKQIEEATKKHVFGVVSKYDGPIYSYSKNADLTSAMPSLKGLSKNTLADIQEDLGEQGSEKHRFEVFLAVKGLEHYKYRMMFVEYGTISYPVTIVLNETLAEEYSGKRKALFQKDSMRDLESMIDEIINSRSMVVLLQNLINESLRQEARERDSVIFERKKEKKAI